MAAPKGNKYWQLAKNIGKPKRYTTPKAMREAIVGYFQWVEDNPIEKTVIYQGEQGCVEKLPRPYTIGGMCIYLEVNPDYFNDFEERLDLSHEDDQEYSRIIRAAKGIIRTQKFEGASVGLFNPNIIARDLGLVDKRESDIKADIGVFEIDMQGMNGAYKGSED